MKTENFRKSENVVDRRPLGDKFNSFPVGDVTRKVEFEDTDKGAPLPTTKSLGRSILARQKARDEDIPQEGPTHVNAAYKFRKPQMPQGDKDYPPPSDEKMNQYEDQDAIIEEMKRSRAVGHYAKGGPVAGMKKIRNKGYRSF